MQVSVRTRAVWLNRKTTDKGRAYLKCCTCTSIYHPLIYSEAMAERNALNAYSGPNALRDYFDPNCQPMLPLVELPRSLNPFHEDGVRIHAKMMSMHPANNVKIMPGVLLQDDGDIKTSDR